MKVDFTSMTFDGDITLYAQWEPAPEPSVTVPAIRADHRHYQRYLER